MEYNTSNENHNNVQPWKDKLEELKALPEYRLDKGAAWGKLYGRLNEKEPGEKSGWYWIAAAWLVFALVGALFFINSTRQKITASEIKATSGGTGNALAKTTEKKDEGKRADAIILQKKAPAVDKKINRKTIKIVSLKPILKLRLTDTVSEQNLAIKPRNDFINPSNNSSGLVIVKPEKNKLRVVHINELGGPVEEMTGVERNVSTHYFQIRFANQEVYASPPGPPTKSIGILKINTPVN